MDIKNPFARRPVPNYPRRDERKCKVKIRKSSDGSINKEISGTCSKEELRALVNIDGKDDNFVQAEE